MTVSKSTAVKATATALKFRRVAAVSLPLLSLDYGKDGAPVSKFIKIETAFAPYVSTKEDAKEGMTKGIVTNLETGEQFDMYLHEGLAKKFDVGVSYEVVTVKQKGKRYPENTIYKIEVE